MLKSQGIEAISDSVPPFQVFICARRRPQLNTLRCNTQTGWPLVPCANALPGPADGILQTPAIQQELYRHRSFKREVVVAWLHALFGYISSPYASRSCCSDPDVALTVMVEVTD